MLGISYPKGLIIIIYSSILYSRLAFITTTDRMIQSLWDDTIRIVAAECTGFSRLTCGIIQFVLLATDGMLQTRWDDTVGCEAAVCAGLTGLAIRISRKTDPVIQSRRGRAVVLQVPVVIGANFTWIPNWNDVAAGGSGGSVC